MLYPTEHGQVLGPDSTKGRWARHKLVAKIAGTIAVSKERQIATPAK